MAYTKRIWDKIKMLTILHIWDVVKTSYSSYRELKCRCDCWNIKITKSNVIGRIKSCWCLLKNWGRTIHGLSKTRFYNIWQWAEQRCNNEKSDAYEYYWGRWIKCEWNNFIEFRDDMYESYLVHEKKYWTKETTIDRINAKWNYSKENCRWATYKEQANNKIDTWFHEVNRQIKKTLSNIEDRILNPNIIRYDWVWKNLSDWCRELNLNISKVTSRVSVMWWTKKEALWLDIRGNKWLHKNKHLWKYFWDCYIIWKKKGKYILQCFCGKTFCKSLHGLKKVKKVHCWCLFKNRKQKTPN